MFYCYCLFWVCWLVLVGLGWVGSLLVGLLGLVVGGCVFGFYFSFDFILLLGCSVFFV